MRLKTFEISNYRSINKSGSIDASQVTAFVGRNESGKSNILRGLCSLNPVGGFTALSPIKDFPRQRRLSECTDATEVVRSVWELTEDKQAELGRIWPRAQGVASVTIGRRYAGTGPWVEIVGRGLGFAPAEIRKKLRKIVAAGEAAAGSLDEGNSASVTAAAAGVSALSDAPEEPKAWVQPAAAAFALLRPASRLQPVESACILTSWAAKVPKSSGECGLSGLTAAPLGVLVLLAKRTACLLPRRRERFWYTRHAARASPQIQTETQPPLLRT